MIATLKLIILLFFTIAVFFIDNYLVLGIIAISEVLLIIVLKVKKVKKVNMIKTMLYLLPFIVFTGLINYILVNLNVALLITIRLYLVCIFTYIYKTILTPIEISEAIQNICYPLKLIGINPKDISLIVSIGIAFVPIIQNELKQIIYALKLKGVNLKSFHVIKNLQYILKPLLCSTLRRTNELEYALKLKGYTE